MNDIIDRAAIVATAIIIMPVAIIPWAFIIALLATVTGAPIAALPEWLPVLASVPLALKLAGNIVESMQ